MTKDHEVIELYKDSVILELPPFYSRYAGSYFYYQQRKKYSKDDSNTEYIEFIFHLNKCDAREKDENGTLLPILMCHITQNGKLPCPEEILKVMRNNDNKIFFYSNGYCDFKLSTHQESKTGLTTEDENFLINLFNNINTEENI